MGISLYYNFGKRLKSEFLRRGLKVAQREVWLIDLQCANAAQDAITCSAVLMSSSTATTSTETPQTLSEVIRKAHDYNVYL